MKKYAVVYEDGCGWNSREVIDFVTAEHKEAAERKLQKRFDDYLYSECHCEDEFECYCGVDDLEDCECDHDCNCEIYLEEVDLDIVYWDWREDAYYSEEGLRKKDREEKRNRCEWLADRQLEIEKEILRLKQKYAELGEESDKLKVELDKE